MKTVVPKIIKNTVQRKNPIQEKASRSSSPTEYEAWIRQRSDRQRSTRSTSLTSTSRFLRSSTSTKRDRCARDVTKASSNSPNLSPRNVEMHQAQSIDTVDIFSVNRQRQVPRTGPAQWRFPRDVSCDATQVPMVQKMQKTVEILQVPHIDKVIEVPQAQLIDEAVELLEIMQRHDPCGRLVLFPLW